MALITSSPTTSAPTSTFSGDTPAPPSTTPTAAADSSDSATDAPTAPTAPASTSGAIDGAGGSSSAPDSVSAAVPSNDDDDSSSSNAVLALGVAPLWVPCALFIVFGLYVSIRYRHVETLYLKWRFSHSWQSVSCCYIAADERAKLWTRIDCAKQMMMEVKNVSISAEDQLRTLSLTLPHDKTPITSTTLDEKEMVEERGRAQRAADMLQLSSAMYKSTVSWMPQQAAAQRNPFMHRQDIDGLRAVAVIAVTLFHMDESWIPGAFTGVDIFFVMSGYVVAGSMLKPARTFRYGGVGSFLLAFYARRVKRLTPALLVTTCITAFFMALYIPPYTKERDEYFTSGMLGLVGWANNFYAQGGAHDSTGSTGGGGYFAAESGSIADSDSAPKKNPFLHFWSLGVEEQFYFVFPLLLLFAYGPHAASVPAVSYCSARRPVSTARFIIGFWFCLSVILAGALSYSKPDVAFYIMPTRFWELVSGALLFDFQFFGQRWWDKMIENRVLVEVLEVAALTFIAVGFAVTPDGDGFPFPWAIFAACGTLCFIAAGTAEPHHRSIRLWTPWSTYVTRIGFPLFNELLAHDICTYIGRLSYPLYLWHWPFLVILKWTTDPSFEDVLDKIAVVSMSVAAAALTYHLPEARVKRWRPKKTWHVLALFLPLTALTELWLGLPRGPLREKLCVRNCEGPSAAAIEVCIAPMDGPYTGFPISSDSECSCVAADSVSRVPSGAVAIETVMARPCFSTWDDSATVADLSCTACFDLGTGIWNVQEKESMRANIANCLGDVCPEGDSQRKLFLVGDSHCVNYHAALRIASEGRMSVVAMSSPQCGYRPVELTRLEPVSRCERYLSALHDVLRQKVKAGDIVAVTAFTDTFASPAYLRETDTIRRANFPTDLKDWLLDAVDAGMLDTSLSTLGMNEFMSQLRELHDIAAASGASLLLLGDIPKLETPGPAQPSQQSCLDLVWDLSCIGSGTRSRRGCARPWPRPEWFWEELVRAEYQAFAQSRSDVFYFDGADLFAEDGVCTGHVPGTRFVAYIDADHLSDAGSAYMWPFLCSFLQESEILSL